MLRLTVAANCTLCGAALSGEAMERGKCPSCGSTPRTRSAVPVLNHVTPAVMAGRDPADLSVLGFAVTGAERKIIAPYFGKLTSVSLYGSYGKQHIGGVDTRDLSRFADNSFDAYFGVLLFDYFLEHEIALCEAFRVLRPGGLMLTHMASNRVIEGNKPPAKHSLVVARGDYFRYLPEGVALDSIKVGRQWFVNATARAGFAAENIQAHEEGTAQVSEWFVGIKPGKPETAGSAPATAQAVP